MVEKLDLTTSAEKDGGQSNKNNDGVENSTPDLQKIIEALKNFMDKDQGPDNLMRESVYNNLRKIFNENRHVYENRYQEAYRKTADEMIEEKLHNFFVQFFRYRVEKEKAREILTQIDKIDPQIVSGYQEEIEELNKYFTNKIRPKDKFITFSRFYHGWLVIDTINNESGPFKEEEFTQLGDEKLLVADRKIYFTISPDLSDLYLDSSKKLDFLKQGFKDISYFMTILAERISEFSKKTDQAVGFKIPPNLETFLHLRHNLVIYFRNMETGEELKKIIEDCIDECRLISKPMPEGIPSQGMDLMVFKKDNSGTKHLYETFSYTEIISRIFAKELNARFHEIGKSEERPTDKITDDDLDQYFKDISEKVIRQNFSPEELYTKFKELRGFYK
jgi:5'-deoxynucleotidase YfbR-like HD superfamily hydrolase